MTLYEVWYTRKHHAWLLCVEHCQCLPAVFVFINVLPAMPEKLKGRTSLDFYGSWGTVVILARYVSPVKIPIVIADNAQAVCGYMETSLMVGNSYKEVQTQVQKSLFFEIIFQHKSCFTK